VFFRRIQWKDDRGGAARVVVGVAGHAVEACMLSAEALKVVHVLVTECRRMGVSPVTRHGRCRGRGEAVSSLRCLYCVAVQTESVKFCTLDGTSMEAIDGRR
jgi:hypothetical protein